MHLYSTMLISLIVTLAGCYNSSSNDANITTASSGADSSLSSSEPLVSSNQSISSEHSSETSNSSISNLGKNQNTLGYYGDGVYLREELVVGEWVLLPAIDYGKSTLYRLYLYQNGDGQMSVVQGLFENKWRIAQYGVDENGSKIVYQNVYDEPSAEMNCSIEIFDKLNPDGCYYPVTYRYVYMDSTISAPLFETKESLRLCKIAQQ